MADDHGRDGQQPVAHGLELRSRDGVSGAVGASAPRPGFVR